MNVKVMSELMEMPELIMVGSNDGFWMKKEYSPKKGLRVIRRNCFETNSSSQHSIVVTKNNTHVTEAELLGNNSDSDDNYFEHVYIYSDGKVGLRDVRDGFGRYPFQLLTTFKEKLAYAMCEYLGCLYPDDPKFQEYYEMFTEITREVVPGFKEFYIPNKEFDIYLDDDGNMIPHKDLKYDHWDSENSVFVYNYKDKNGEYKTAKFDEDNYLDAPNIGGVDHQSMGLLKNFLKERGIRLKEFLTNKKYVVVIDGDEYCDFDKYLKAGLIDRDFITEIYSTSGEDLEYKQWLEEQKDEESDS